LPQACLKAREQKNEEEKKIETVYVSDPQAVAAIKKVKI